jgi:hypothetical protein
MDSIYNTSKDEYLYYTTLLANSLTECNLQLVKLFNTLRESIIILQNNQSTNTESSSILHDLNIKITKYIELEKPLIDTNGSIVKKIAVRNAFLIERIDSTIEYQNLLNRYYQKLKISSSGTVSCIAIDVFNNIYDTIFKIWQCIQTCSEITNNRITSLYNMVDNLEIVSTDIIDMPQNLIPNKYLRINAAGTAYELVDLEISLNIYTDSTLSGDGSEANPLSVVTNVQNYVYEQGTPSNEWLINHNLGAYPTVTIVDTAKTVIIGTIVYNNINQLTVSFNYDISGQAFINI